MPLYRYKAATLSGQTIEGEAFAANDGQVIAQLQAAGQIPIRVVEGRRVGLFAGRREGAAPQDVLVFTQELSTLLAAGLPLERALQIILDLSDEPRARKMVSRVLDAVRGGAALSEALEAQTGVFSRFYVSMVRAGELGGAMESVLNRLLDYLQRARELRDSVVSALVYPAILMFVSVVSVFVLMVFVVPQFTQLFDDAGRALPLLTQMVVGSANVLRDYWWVLILAVLVTVLLLRRGLSSPEGRLRWDRVVLRLPLIGDLVRKLETARFSRTLGTLLGNGVPALAALSIVRQTLNNRVLADGLDTVLEGLKEGQGVAGPLMRAELFPPLGMQMIKVGEETGRLEAMLMQVADIYDREVRVAVQRMLALLEPALIVGLGLVIATIILSILIAIVSVNELAF